MRGRFVILLALVTSGCGLLYDPCGALEERLCADLGSDCAVFRSSPSISESVIPLRRRKAERAQCEMFAADVNYSSYTLPWVRYLVERTRDPSTRAPSLPRPQPADGLASGISGSFLYLLPVIAIAAILFVSWRARRKLAGAYPAMPPPMAHATPSFDQVTSREQAEALVQAGVLVRVELFPGWLGGSPVPENTTYVTPAAAARKAALDQEVAAMVQARGPVRYVCEPRYKGASFVPASLLVRADEHSTSVDVW